MVATIADAVIGPTHSQAAGFSQLQGVNFSRRRYASFFDAAAWTFGIQVDNARSRRAFCGFVVESKLAAHFEKIVRTDALHQQETGIGLGTVGNQMGGFPSYVIGLADGELTGVGRGPGSDRQRASSTKYQSVIALWKCQRIVSPGAKVKRRACTSLPTATGSTDLTVYPGFCAMTCVPQP